jgi:hypothetical protein
MNVFPLLILLGTPAAVLVPSATTLSSLVPRGAGSGGAHHPPAPGRDGLVEIAEAPADGKQLDPISLTQFHRK